MKKRHTARKVILLVITVIIIAVPCQMLISGYVKSLPELNYTFGDTATKSAAYPNAKFAVISDTHYYDNSLGTSGSAFESCYNSERKLMKSSADLLNFSVNRICASGVKFVLVTGDLTKDGELVDHQHVALVLSKLTKKGIKVYVIPGNHDVNNPGAFRYVGNKAIPVPSVSAAQFAKIYKNFGYGDNIMRDPSSLSYVAQPENGLWIVALDSCRYSENKKGSIEIGSGRLTQREETWLEGVLVKAQVKGEAVIVMVHHGVVEHWKGQSKLSPDYLLNDYKNIGKLLASYNVRLAFTGHYHAQDITRGDFGQYGSLYDVETGSLITPPCPIRYCTISHGLLNISSEDILGKIHPATDFEKKSIAFVKKSIFNANVGMLRKYHISGSDTDYIANAITAAYIAHYNGDENAALRPAFNESKLSFFGQIVYDSKKYIIDGLWSDLPPSDNNCVIDLAKG